MSYHSRLAESLKPGPSSSPTSKSKRFHPYFTPTELSFLSEKQRGKWSYNLDEKTKREACSLIELVGSRLGFPHRTIGTAQTLYHRFHLFFPMKDFLSSDVALACLYVSTKVHDTLKKPRDIIVASYQVRFPEEAERARAKGGEMEVNQKQLDHDKMRLVAVERLVLETMCFNFKVHTPFSYVIKCGRALGASKELTKFAYKLAIDSHRTAAPLEHPPHTLALASLYLAALLTAFPEHGGISPLQETEWPVPHSHSHSHSHSNSQPQPQPSNGHGHADEHDRGRRRADVPRRTAREVGEELGTEGWWCRRFGARVSDLREIVHHMLDLLSSQPAQAIHSLSTSPQTPLTPSSPSPHQPQPSPGAHPPLPGPSTNTNTHTNTIFTPAHLTRLKIFLREKEEALGGPPDRPQTSSEDPSAQYAVAQGTAGVLGGGTHAASAAADVWGDGKDGGTVRFFFD